MQNIRVVGLDSITNYYDVNIKYERLNEIEAICRDWRFVKGNLADKSLVDKLFEEERFSVVVNLAA